MNTYEALYIVRPDASDDEIQTVAKQVEQLVTDNGGAIVRSEIWGKRKLAYTVKKHSEGVYILLRFQAEPTFISRLEQYYRLSDFVIRFLTVLFDDKTLRLEEEQRQRVEAEVQASASRGRDRDDDDDDEPIVARGRGRSRRDDDDDDDD